MAEGSLHQRLDRALGNDLWQMSTLNTMVHNLHKLKSDHRPILVSSNYTMEGRRERPFHFIASWLEHSKFRDLVLDSWKTDRNIFENIGHFTNLVKEWNTTVFGNIFIRKRKSLRELECVQKALEVSNSRRLK